MQALRTAVPWSFGGFVVGGLAFAALQPGNLLARLSLSIIAALGVMSVVLVAALAVQFSVRLRLASVPLVLGSIVSFATTLPRDVPHTPLAFFRTLGASGMFLAMLVCFSVLGGALIARRYTPSYGAWIGASVVTMGFACLWVAHVSLASTIVLAMAPLGRLGDSFPALLLVVFLDTILWTVGVHGPALLAAVVTPVYLALQAQNLEAYNHGDPLPHVVTVSTFLFIFPGGAGATLPLALLLLRSGAARTRTVARAALVPSLFNINEPLIFGLPIILEPTLAIPFVAAPLVLAAITYGATAAGLVARPAWYVPSSIPFGINAVIATTDWRAAVLSIVNLAVATAIYVPFLRLFERSRDGAEA